MKILITLYGMSSISGLINNTENLVAGFMELGHEVELVKLLWKESAKSGARKLEAYAPGVLYPIHQHYGWAWPTDKLIPYKGKDNIKKWKKFASGFDLVLWNIPVPTPRKEERWNTDWLQLYDIPVTQVAYVHDAHMPKAYPHMYYIADKLAGVGCTNLAGYHSIKLDVPKVLALPPMPVDDSPEEVIEYKHREKGFIAPQTFKRWKRVDDLLRAIPYIPEDIRRLVAGDGIERCYMTSKTKTKAIYKYEDGRKIWDVAVEHGMEYLGFLHVDKRDEILSNIKTLIDPSWSQTFAKFGGHHNKTVMEAIMMGAIPVATNLGMTGNETGDDDIFQAGVHYIMVPYDSTPREYAAVIEYANNLSNVDAEFIQDEGYRLLKYWDRKATCQQFIDLAKGKDTISIGNYGKRVVSKIPKSLVIDADKIMTNFFGFQ